MPRPLPETAARFRPSLTNFSICDSLGYRFAAAQILEELTNSVAGAEQPTSKTEQNKSNAMGLAELSKLNLKLKVLESQWHSANFMHTLSDKEQEELEHLLDELQAELKSKGLK